MSFGPGGGPRRRRRCQPHHTERVRDLLGVWQRHLDRGPIRARDVQHRPRMAQRHARGPIGKPLRGRFGRPASDYVQQLAPPDVDDASRPGLGPEASPPLNQMLIEPECLSLGDALNIDVQQRLASAAHRRVHRMPTTSQLRSDLFERAATARLARHPTSRPCRQLLARRRNSGVLLSDRPRRALQARTAPPAFVPHQPHPPPERGEVHQLHQPLTVGPQPSQSGIGARRRTCPRVQPRTLTPLTPTSNAKSPQYTRTRGALLVGCMRILRNSWGRCSRELLRPPRSSPQPFRVIGARARQGRRNSSCNSKRVFLLHFCDPPIPDSGQRPQSRILPVRVRRQVLLRAGSVRHQMNAQSILMAWV